MMKIVLPVLLAGVVMIAGIFAFMPVDKATTVHTTIQGSQLNNVNSTYDTDLSSNATATCSSGSFLVFWTFTNNTAGTSLDFGGSDLGIDDPTDGSTSTDFVVSITPLNQTTVSGVTAGTADETITFFGNSSGGTSGAVSFEDVGDLSLTVICQSTATPSLIP